jgi:hypothetical protein
MSSRKQHIALPKQEQLDQVLNEQWNQEVLPRLPKDLEEQAQILGAFVRIRHLRHATDLLRALLAYALCGLSFRGLGIWAVLTGIGSLSEKAWRKRLFKAEAWIKWVRCTLIATAQRPDWLPEGLKGTGIVLMDFSCIKVIGGTGDDVRLHLGYDLLAGCMDHVVVSDHHQAESIPEGLVHQNWIYVSDSGYRQGYVATVIKQGGQVVVRRHGHALHLEEKDGRVIDVRALARELDYEESQSLSGWINLPGKGQRAHVRVVLFHLPKEQVKKARESKVAKAKAKGKKLNEEVLWWVEWVVIVTTLPEQDWSNELILRLYRARWQIELLFKRMKTFLQMHVLRLKQIERASLVIQLLLIGWALYEQEAQVMREMLQEIATSPHQETMVPMERVLSTWTLTAIGLQSLKQIVWGGWSQRRWHTCLPWLLRYLCQPRRKRGHQETEIRAQLLAFTSPLWKRGKELAVA